MKTQLSRHSTFHNKKNKNISTATGLCVTKPIELPNLPNSVLGIRRELNAVLLGGSLGFETQSYKPAVRSDNRVRLNSQNLTFSQVINLNETTRFKSKAIEYFLSATSEVFKQRGAVTDN